MSQQSGLDMTDIVVRLRNLGWPTCHEAADEIERLQERIKLQAAHYAQAVADVAELRAVLSGLADAVADEVSRALEPKP